MDKEDRLKQILKYFPLSKPDRVLASEDRSVIIAEWHNDGKYFEIEVEEETGDISAMFCKDGEDSKHWAIIGD